MVQLSRIFRRDDRHPRSFLYGFPCNPCRFAAFTGNSHILFKSFRFPLLRYFCIDAATSFCLWEWFTTG